MNREFAGSAQTVAGSARRYAQPPGPLYLPFVYAPQIVHMGLNRLSGRDWIQPCPQLPNYQHNKLCARRRLQQGVFASEPRSLPAQRELASTLLGHLLGDHRAYHREAERLVWRGAGHSLHWPLAVAAAEPLWDASLWVADDICLLLPGAHGYELAAASLAAPSYWKLEDKIGRPLNQIHKPVPGFKEQLAAQMGRFFDHLRPEYPVWRGNWSVVDSPELLQRGGGSEPGDRLYLRVERQSLRRLPETGAVAFTIRVTINPLSDLLSVEGAVSALASAVAGMSPRESRYKSLAPLLPRLQQFFAEQASAPAAAQGAQ
ncbi:heme-dependent oxidative N-demethylase family protein [Microbulbifer sp. SA54]|uniref:heme-dependent oxidative N-demethylase family protein n=1 Tax=Microbulbifer sp. SA54 TaxID=3401577 RepID=UPI003AAAE0BC